VVSSFHSWVIRIVLEAFNAAGTGMVLLVRVAVTGGAILRSLGVLVKIGTGPKADL